MANQLSAFAIPSPTGSYCGFQTISSLPARPVDLVHLALQTHGNRDLEAEVLGLFVCQSKSQIARIAVATSGQAQFEAAHQLKGSARAIGAASVAECAEVVEQIASSGGDIAASLSDLSRAVTIANAFISDLLD